MTNIKEIKAKILGNLKDEQGNFIIDENMPESKRKMMEFYNDNHINYSSISDETNLSEYDENYLPVDPEDEKEIDDEDVIFLEDDEDDSQSVDDIFADL